MEILSILSGLIIGALSVYAILTTRLNGLRKDLEVERSRTADREGRINDLTGENSSLRERLNAEIEEKIVARTELKAAGQNIIEQRRILDEARTELSNTFSALSAAALKSSSEDFLNLARESLKSIYNDTQNNLTLHKTSMDALINPLKESLKNYDEQTRQLEERHREEYGSLREQLKQIALGHEQLSRETSNLVNALRKPHVRGRWGEMQLRRTVELAGMEERCDFSVQETLETGLRPDMIIHLPSGRDIVVDVKVSLDAYLESISAQTESEASTALKRHASQVRDHMNRLGQKAYWESAANASKGRHTPEFVVLFLPAESFFSAALQYDPTLIEDGFQKKVIIATPTTLVALLKAVSYGWRQESLNKNAEMVSRLGRELYERFRTFSDNLAKLGRAINSTITAFNAAAGTYERRLMPQARRFKELGAASGEEIAEVDEITSVPRLVIEDPSTRITDSDTPR